MAACPNCGRPTLRTKDWACQWCGYPLISRAFKKIDKTFKELQEERSQALGAAAPEDESESEPEYEPEDASEPEPGPEPPAKPVFRHQTPPEYIPAPPRIEPPPRREPPARPVQPVQPPQPPPVINLPPPQAASDLPPFPLQQPEIVPAPPPAVYTPPPQRPAPPPETRIEPAPPPQAPVRADAIQDGMEITVDQIDALFRTEKSAANSRLAGKTLVIRGIVEKIFVREHLEIRYIILAGTQKKMTWSLRCSFEKENSSPLSRLKEGQEAAVRGKYDGYGKNIIFKDCALV